MFAKLFANPNASAMNATSMAARLLKAVGVDMADLPKIAEHLDKNSGINGTPAEEDAGDNDEDNRHGWAKHGVTIESKGHKKWAVAKAMAASALMEQGIVPVGEMLKVGEMLSRESSRWEKC